MRSDVIKNNYQALTAVFVYVEHYRMVFILTHYTKSKKQTVFSNKALCEFVYVKSKKQTVFSNKALCEFVYVINCYYVNMICSTRAFLYIVNNV